MIRIRSSTKREVTVAIAAPATPSAGAPSRPKIRMRFRTKFVETDAILLTIGTTTSPVSLRFEAYTWDIAYGIRPMSIMNKYLFASERVSARSPVLSLS